jgi:acetyltransferase-like isoleucine patch superfamily enzyme
LIISRIANRITKELRYISYRKNKNIIDRTNSFGKDSIVYLTKWGRNSLCNFNCYIVDCEIGNYVNVAWNVTISPRSHIYTNFTTHDFVYTNNEHIMNEKALGKYMNKIGHDVWIGCNTTILPGIEIGTGAVIAAGSIVTKSVPPYAIVGGNPARFIKWRFTKEQISELEVLKWYEWDQSEILERRIELERIVDFSISEFKQNYFSRRKDMEAK